MFYKFTIDCEECEGTGKIYGVENGDWEREYECEDCNCEGVTYYRADYETIKDLKKDFPDAKNIQKHTLTEYEKYWLKHNPEVLERDDIERYY